LSNYYFSHQLASEFDFLERKLKARKERERNLHRMKWRNPRK
jgi:hypothetical protein